MTDTSRNLILLWDYGWLDRSVVAIPPCDQPSDVVAAYLRSDDFGTSFVGLQPTVTPDLHGPFWRASITPDDFYLLSSEQFAAAVATIRQPEDFTSPADDAQWQAVEQVTSSLARSHQWIFALRLTEEDRDHWHEWGFVLTIFREFLFADPGSDRLERCVFGYD